MGETSKRNGENGEKIVANFLDRVGYGNALRGEDIDSYDKEYRKNTNGIDGFFHYKNPMIDDSVINILYSVKFSKDQYPQQKGARTEFTSHFSDLAKAIESFKYSELKSTTNASYENISSEFDRGILFWINNINEVMIDGKPINHDIISLIANARLPEIDAQHDGILVVDNARMDFIHEILDFTEVKFKDYDINFLYFKNGKNQRDTTQSFGKRIPIEFLGSSIIPIRCSKDNETVLCLFSKDGFNTDNFSNICSLAKNLTTSMQGKTYLCFPDYSETKHKQDVVKIKTKFYNDDEADFINTLFVESFKNMYRN